MAHVIAIVLIIMAIRLVFDILLRTRVERYVELDGIKMGYCHS